MPPVWKETHRSSFHGNNLANFMSSAAVVAGVVYGLTDARDQLAVAETTAKAAFPSGHPETGLPLGETRSRWLRGDVGDGKGAVAEVILTFGPGAGGVTGGTVDGLEIVFGMYEVLPEDTYQVKGPGDVDQQTTIGIGRVAKFHLVARNSPIVVPNIAVGGASTVTLKFGPGGTNPTLGPVACVITNKRTAGVGFFHIDGEIRKPA